MIKTILLAIDGSSTSKKAAGYTLWLAKYLGAKVILLHVIDETLLRSLFGVAEGSTDRLVLAPVEENLKEGANIYLEEIEKEFKRENIHCEILICSGVPAAEIAREAERKQVDLIVMGTHGRGLIGATFLGSVAYGVIHHDAKIPILLVPRDIQ
ncbi:MAG: universal stress protein [Syntrophales bacterium]|nr:universal stress protein [Syntrophales bacterium]